MDSHTSTFSIDDDIEYITFIEDLTKNLRLADTQYLRKHPEIIAIVRVVLKRLLKKEPECTGQCVAAMMRTENLPEFIRRINSELKNMKRDEFPDEIDSFYCETVFAKSEENEEDSSMRPSRKSSNVDAILSAVHGYPIDLHSFLHPEANIKRDIDWRLQSQQSRNTTLTQITIDQKSSPLNIVVDNNVKSVSME